MTQVTLSAGTQAAVHTALTQGPGAQNINYYNAYTDVANDVENVQGINPGTVNWVTQAGAINVEQFQPSAAGAFIWAYTKAAAASLGVIVTTATEQGSSNVIGHTFFQSLASAGYVLDDHGNAAPPTLIQNDAGSGITYIAQHSINGSLLDNSAWAGSMFATTELNDPTYFSDFKVDLTPGGKDALAMEAGLSAGSEAVGGLAAYDSLLGLALPGATGALYLAKGAQIGAAGIYGATSLDPNAMNAIDATAGDQIETVVVYGYRTWWDEFSGDLESGNIGGAASDLATGLWNWVTGGDTSAGSSSVNSSFDTSYNDITSAGMEEFSFGYGAPPITEDWSGGSYSAFYGSA